ncbi:hypothetical protein OF897_18510 [Chryseobacterium formosus]|uniref:Uncharacterized protein n=1 Tax=Chryseobacterium formosus TaxID=1537363 RepID=A0ABT3XW59_9FLAO|nr:hypothetical protein [Chryseobacterium formosus]MCX8525911.1 hypothetical protein [Chryseobacterium formosus]
MKFIYSIFGSILGVSLFSAQVAIGKTTTQTGVSLEFGTGNKGLILPWVLNTNASATPAVELNPGATAKGGALVLDVNDSKVKISRNNGTWSDLTVHANELPATGGNVAINNALQTGTIYTQNSAAKSQIGGVIGDNTPGILVLADTNKAMIPPLVDNPAVNIKSPAPGMIVFDATKKLFCVYNGTVWSYWRADN